VSDKLRIAQITDCHISAAPHALYRGENPMENLATVVDCVIGREPDLLLVTGDLSEDGSAESYEALARMLARPGVPVLALPGNHDDPALLAAYFPGSPMGDIAVTDHGEWQILRLNSCLPGKPHGRLDGEVLQRLEDRLTEGYGKPRLLALHHQPLPAASAWIDKYRLVNARPFLNLVGANADVRTVVWGHIHQPFEAVMNGMLMLGGPSSVVNSLPGRESFTPDDKGPACRWLELGPDGSVQSSVVWP
jgi:Icc protein